MAIVYLSLGSNIGNRKLVIQQAVDFIINEIGSIIQMSSIYETAPWGFNNENTFLNSVICLETQWSISLLLERILSIEKKLGRIRNESLEGYIARTIDIDILFYDDLVIQEKDVTIPHPLLHLRKFVLYPLAEINQNLIHPKLNKTITELKRLCKDTSEIYRVC